MLQTSFFRFWQTHGAATLHGSALSPRESDDALIPEIEQVGGTNSQCYRTKTISKQPKRKCIEAAKCMLEPVVHYFDEGE